VRSRTTHRALVVAATVGFTLVATVTPALAREQDAGSDPGEPLSPLGTLLIFGVLPVGLFLVIALLVSAGSIARGTRYRPDRVWDATPVEFGIPARPAPAAELTRAAGTDADASPAPPAGPAGPPDDDQSGGGGISARW
jgi:hypothetical protein